MYVKLLLECSTARGSHLSGEVIDLAEEAARAMIEAGIAEEADGAPEAAMLETAPERATLPRARARG